MNAAARVINQGNLFQGHWTDITMSKSFIMMIFLLALVFVSGLGVIYSTNAYRSTYSQVEMEEQQTNRLQLQWSQLLLEQASLARSARVEELAKNKLNMVLPTSKNTYLLHVE